MALRPEFVLAGNLPTKTDAFQDLLQGVQESREAPFKRRLLEQQLAQGEQGLALGEQSLEAGEQAFAAGERTADLADQQQALIGLQAGVNAFERGDNDGVVRAIMDMVPPEEQAQELAEFNANPAQYIAQAKDMISAFKTQSVKSTAEQRERQDLLRDIAPALDEQGNFDPDKANARATAAAQKLQLIAKPGTITGAERVAEDPELTEKVATSKAKIKSAIKLAEKQAAARGETLTDLGRAKAALPGITEVVSKLKTLSDEATFTLGGKAFNEVAKQFGLPTKGDTARSSMTAIVDNQVLPLLRPIFGAAFTKTEGDSLKQALVNPDSTPDSRKAQLDAFLEQMQRNIETKSREVGRQDGQIMIDAQGNRARVFPDGTFEEL